MLTLDRQRQLQSRNAALERTTRQQKQELELCQHRIRKLQWEIKELMRQLFGGQRAETISDNQLQRALAERHEQEVCKKEVVGYTRREKKDGDPQPRIPEHLEAIREEIIPEEVQADPDAWEKIGEEVTEEILATRSKQSRPILDEIYKQLQKDRQVILAGGSLGEAINYTLIESRKRHGIEPQAYLTDILKKLPTMTNHQAVKLTPDKWKAQVN